MKFNKFPLAAWASVFFASIAVLKSAGADELNLNTVWSASPTPLSLKSWSRAELSKLKTASSREKDIQSGKIDRWKGVLVTSLVEKTLLSLPLDQRAMVDLVVFKNGNGIEAAIPRSLAKKYPLLLAFERNRKPLTTTEGPFTVVVPWTSAPRISGEGLPLPAFQLGGVMQVELASYQAKYKTLFLKRRTDPAAIRGEKLFIQNCVSCHGAGRAKSLEEFAGRTSSRAVASAGHPESSGAPKLGDRDLRSLTSYLDAYRSESPVVSTLLPRSK